MIVALALAAVLVALALLHVAWGFGAAWGKSAAVPEVGGGPAFVPSRAATLAVAVALLVAAVVALRRGGVLWEAFPGSPTHWITILIGIVFVVRAVGDFRLVGFFKRVKDTRFARLDTRLYSPLCVLLGLGFLYVATL